MPVDTYVWNNSEADGDTTVAANWTPAGPPSNEDSVIFPAWAVGDVTGNADFPSGSTSGAGFKSVVIEEGVTYNIGSRALPLELGMDNENNDGIRIGGTGEYHFTPIDYEEIVITEAGPAPANGRYAVNITGALLDSTTTGAVRIYCEDNMSIGIGAEADAIGEVDELYVYGGDVTVGPGVTLNDASAAFPLVMTGGTLRTSCPLTTADQSGGGWTHDAGVVDALTLSGGTLYYASTETISTLIVRGDGTFDATENSSGFTITNDVEMYEGATFLDPNQAATAGVVLNLNACGIDEVTVDLGEHIGLTREFL